MSDHKQKEAPKIAHTLTACCRCRKRKSRCDDGLPRCGPCTRASRTCEYFDAAKGRNVPRSYVIELEGHVRKLEKELEDAEAYATCTPDPAIMARSAGLIRFNENDESRFLGPSSGIAITRLVLDFAKRTLNVASITDIVPATKAKQIKEKFKQEQESDEKDEPQKTSWPLTSRVPAANLLKREIADKIVGIFNIKAQYLMPTLHEPTFRQDLNDVYNGSKDAYQNFVVRMVFAISLQKMNVMFAGLADSYYLAALPFLEDVAKRLDVHALQCFTLIGQYSMLTPTRTPSFWIVGLAAKLCQELRIDHESTISYDEYGTKLNALEIDMRRRVYWMVLSMELGLSHGLGRPCAFGVTWDHIDVKLFEPIDDRFITANGIIPAEPIMKKRIAIHFCKMRILQAEIRQTLYYKKRLEPRNDRHPWFVEMEKKLWEWKYTCPKKDEGSGLSDEWFQGKLNAMIILLFRPSPQVPRPSVRAAKECFKAAHFNIYLQRSQINRKVVDFSWIFAQSLFMALNTMLWCLSYPEIRQENTREEVTKHLQTVSEAIDIASQRWSGVASASMLYRNLVTACLMAYDVDEASFSPIPSPLSHMTTATSPYDSTASPSSNYSGISTVASVPTLLATRDSPLSQSSLHDYDFASHQLKQTSSSYEPMSHQPTQHPYSNQFQQAIHAQSNFQSVPQTSGLMAHPQSAPIYNHGLPTWLEEFKHCDSNFSIAPIAGAHLPLGAQMDPELWMASIGYQYSQYFGVAYSPEQQQLEMLDTDQQHQLQEVFESSMAECPPFDESAMLFSGAD